MFDEIKTIDDLVNTVNRYGFLPFYNWELTGFSILETATDESLWGRSAYGPWEWKGPLIRDGILAYGKFFRGKAGFLALDLLPDFANYRRDGYDFDSLCDEGFVNPRVKSVYNLIESKGKVLSKEIKRILAETTKEATAIETILTKLQMQMYISPADYAYTFDKKGNRIGWGIAEYAKSETVYGEDYIRSAYDRKPEESFRRIIDRVSSAFPEFERDKIIYMFEKK